jgi:hypothetical protein
VRAFAFACSNIADPYRGGAFYRDVVVNLRSGLGLANVPPEIAKSEDRMRLPGHQDADGDGYPKIGR